MMSYFHNSTDIDSMDKYLQICEYANQNPEAFWSNLANEKIEWIKPYTNTLNSSNAPYYSWFDGGKLNISNQCIDRHLKDNGQKTAIIWESESGQNRIITYYELSFSVNKFANLLTNNFNIKKGDRVVIYLPMIPEAIFAMLACAKIGAIHVVVFGGFSADVLRERIIDTKASLVITADGAFRHGKPYLLKTIVDEALNNETGKFCKKVLLIEHNHEKIIIKKGRDFSYQKLIKIQNNISSPAIMDSEDTLFILHTSGSTGKPKGIRHTNAGYILWAQYTTEIVFKLKKDDIFWCTADLGWITGHTYGVYGPLAVGATLLMYEGIPNYPDAGRWWDIIDKHKVTQFYTAPTAIRLLHKIGEDEPKKHDLSSLKVLGTVGEPINPEAWNWYSESIGKNRCPIVDTWWQTETGGHMIAPIPGATPTIPGSATLPLPGICAEILDTKGNKVKNGEHGFLCITKPWPSMFRSIWNDSERYKTSYFNTICKDNNKNIYFSGDGAYYDENGYITITGRVDDVMNVSGHRVSSAEIESAISIHENIAESAVVSRPDEITGESIVAYVVLKNDFPAKEDLIMSELNSTLSKQIGPIIKIKKLIIVPGLPKTRSGKIIRRVLRTIAHGEKPTEDISTIENSEIIDVLIDLYKQQNNN